MIEHDFRAAIAEVGTEELTLAEARAESSDSKRRLRELPPNRRRDLPRRA